MGANVSENINYKANEHELFRYSDLFKTKTGTPQYFYIYLTKTTLPFSDKIK